MPNEFPKVTQILKDRDRSQTQNAKYCLTRALWETDFLDLILRDSDSFTVGRNGMKGGMDEGRDGTMDPGAGS